MTDLTTPQASMHDVMVDVGFRPNPRLVSDPPGGLSLDLGDGLVLDAVHNIDLSFERGITLSGICRTARTLTMIEYRVPERVATAQLGVALIAYCLDLHLGRAFQPVRPQPWLEEGRRSRGILPWDWRTRTRAGDPFA